MFRLLLGKCVDYPCSPSYCWFNIKQELRVALKHCINLQKLLKTTFHSFVYSFFKSITFFLQSPLEELLEQNPHISAEPLVLLSSVLSTEAC